MADRRVRYILEVDYDGESATLKAADDLRDVDAAATQAGEGLERARFGFSEIQASIVTAQSALGLVEQGFGAMQQAAQMAYETLSEGAALVQQKEQFDNLASSIGTTADVLENDLGAATMGLQTRAEMVAGAAQLMSLGLAKNHDEVVALSEVSGQLGWDIQVLGLTIANQSTARLDALGLSIESVTSKLEGFKAQGMSTDDAFKWAIIEAGREKIEIVGSTADTTAGQLQILENIVAGVQDEFARGAAEAFADTLSDIGAGAEGAGAGLGMAGGLLGGGLVDSLMWMVNHEPQIAQALGLGWLSAAGKWVPDLMMLNAQLHNTRDVVAEYHEMQQAVQGSSEGVVEVTGRVAFQGEVATVAMQEYAASQEWVARAAEWAADANERARAADYGRSQAVAEEAAATEAAAAAQAAWTTYTEEATARGGDYFTQAIQEAEAQWDLGEAIYAAADARGAGIGTLGDLGVAYGMLDEKARAAGEAQAQQQAVIDNLAAAAEAGIITWDQYGEAVERALRVLEGKEYLIDLGPREMPEVDMRGFRESFQENFEAGGVGKPWVVEIDAETAAVQAAVDEATGMLSGFVETPYEGTATLNIDAVVAGVEEIQRLMAEVPEQRSVQFDFSATGLEFIDELRAAGVIP